MSKVGEHYRESEEMGLNKPKTAKKAVTYDESFLSETDIYDNMDDSGPSDDELKQIEQELLDDFEQEVKDFPEIYHDYQ